MHRNKEAEYSDSRHQVEQGSDCGDTQEGRAPRIAIIGAGFGGIATGVKLKRAGISSFAIYERAPGPGGVWLQNRYPGAEVDSPSNWYSFSFRSHNWARTHARQSELLEYFEQVIREEDLDPHLNYGHEVRSAVWDASARSYELTFGDGSVESFDVVVSAVGLFNTPKLPEWPGLKSFDGPVLHSAEWDPTLDLEGKRIGLVGTGSTGAQLVRALAPVASHLTLFQRSPGWVTSKGEREYSDEERRQLARPMRNRWERFLSFAHEQRRLWAGREMQPGTRANRRGQKVAELYIERTLGQRPELRAAMTPTHPFYGKRPVRSSMYYETLLRENVSVVPHAVDRVHSRGVTTGDGTHHEIDVLVLATGFRASEYLAGLKVLGRSGESLHSRWDGAPTAFLGITVPGFPNFYMLYGPNTNMGTIPYMLEQQADFVVRNIKRMRREGVVEIDTLPWYFERYNAWLQKRLAQTVWVATDTYFKTESGKIVLPFPTAPVIYAALCRLLRVPSSRAYRGHREISGKGYPSMSKQLQR